MADNHFDQTMVWDDLGDAVRIRRNGQVQVLDPATDNPVTVVQNGVTQVGYVTSDSKGRATFIAQQPTVKLVASGVPILATSSEAATAGAANAAAAQAAQAGAETARNDAQTAASAAASSVSTRVVKDTVTVFVDDYGTVGNGTTNDATAIAAAVAAAQAAKAPLVFAQKRYAIASTVSFPAGLTVRAAGATFVKTVNSSTYAIAIGADVTIDALNVEVAGGATAEAGVQITGSRVAAGSVKVTSNTADQAGTNALLIGNPGGAAVADISIGAVTLTQFRSPWRVVNAERVDVRNIRITNYMTGLYLIDVTNSFFRGARVSGTSPAANGTAGQNAMLMEAQAADGSCSNVLIEDWIAEDAPEHTFRIGGSLACRSITFRRCEAVRPGNAAGNVATGGGGFKALGVSGHHHTDIVYDTCSVIDGNTNAAGINNHAAFNIGHCDRTKIFSPVVAPRANTVSSKLGIVVASSAGTYVTNPNISKVTQQGVYLLKDGTDPAPLPVTDFQLTGGTVGTSSTSTQAVLVDAGDLAFANIQIDTLADGGANAFRAATPTGAGAYNYCHFKVKYTNAPTASTSPPILGTNTIYLDYTGPVYGSFGLPGADGSRYTDTGTGAFRIRKAASWVTL